MDPELVSDPKIEMGTVELVTAQEKRQTRLQSYIIDFYDYKVCISFLKCLPYFDVYTNFQYTFKILYVPCLPFCHDLLQYIRYQTKCDNIKFIN